jgi:beta-lactamase regulating signal transducer with metallopeptidase domain
MLWWLAQNALVAAGLAVLAALAGRGLRLSPALRHALWVVVLLKLLTPPGVFWPWSLPDAWLPGPDAAPAPAPVTPGPAPAPDRMADPPPAPRPVPVTVAPPAGPAVAAPRAAPAPAVAPAPVPPPVPAPNPVSHVNPVPEPSPGVAPRERLARGVELVWLVGVLAAAALHLRRVRGLCRLASWGRPAPDWLDRHTAELAARVGVRPPRVRVVPGRGSPFLWCLGRPVLLVPAGLLGSLPADCWPGLLVHELAHLRRRDHWVSWLLLPAACLWWWNPLFWLVRRRVQLYAELSCDAWVVATLPEQRRPFAETLIEVTRLISLAPPAPALGMGPADRRAFERRLTMILHDRARNRAPRAALAALGLLAAAVLPGFSPGQPPGGKDDGKGDATAMPRPLPPEQALVKARVNGKYAMLLRQFRAEQDAAMHKEFADVGLRDVRSYAGQDDLPKGYWVYAYPHWYIWRDLTSNVPPKRNWGPEQVTGEPDTPQAGDRPTAWASRTPDGQDEWLLLEYAEPVVPRAVMVHETYNPGAVVRVTAFRLDGTEVEVWKGVDPTPPDEPMGVSVIPVKVDFKTNRIKVYIDSKSFPGWNEIDAVGLRDDAGKVLWAAAVEASSNYAELQARAVGFVPGMVGISAETEQRIMNLEKDVRELKEMNIELLRTLKQMRDQMEKDRNRKNP